MLFEAPQVISASGTQTLVQSGENYHYRHSAKLGKGTHVLLGTYKPTYWTKKADGKWAMAKTRADFPDAQSCGLYSMSGKSFVIIDDDGAFATKPLGKGYEITPLASPNDIKVSEYSIPKRLYYRILSKELGKISSSSRSITITIGTNENE